MYNGIKRVHSKADKLREAQVPPNYKIKRCDYSLREKFGAKKSFTVPLPVNSVVRAQNGNYVTR